jgi:putative flippase GtrA
MRSSPRTPAQEELNDRRVHTGADQIECIVVEPRSVALEAILAFHHTPAGRKAIRYSLVSALCVLVSQSVLLVTFGILSLGSAVICNIIATAVAAIPSYYLNRWWAWGKRGRSHLVREVIPFWVLAFVGLALSLWMVSLAQHEATRLAASHLEAAALVNMAALFAFGIVWIGKFVIFNRWVFAPHDRPERAR